MAAPASLGQNGQTRSFKAAASNKSSGSGTKVERMTVFGAGLMGAGIAQVGAQNGLKVGV
jgi:3-hydroxyacyl-CoA dehydrogenase